MTVSTRDASYHPRMTDRGSQTAEVMALFRALETLEAPRDRLFADPYAARFLRPAGRLLLSLARLHPIRRRILRIHRPQMARCTDIRRCTHPTCRRSAVRRAEKRCATSNHSR